MANTDRFGANQHFAWARLADAHFFDDQRGTHLMENGSFHEIFLGSEVRNSGRFGR
jgi:hypothetical protein